MLLLRGLGAFSAVKFKREAVVWLLQFCLDSSAHLLCANPGKQVQCCDRIDIICPCEVTLISLFVGVLTQRILYYLVYLYANTVSILYLKAVLQTQY